MEQMISTAPAVMTAERKPLRVYVAGSSTGLELHRAKAFMDAARERGMVVTHDWPKLVLDRLQSVGLDANQGMTRQERTGVALDCIRGVMECEVCVVLVPSHGSPTIGAWFEADRALSMGKLVLWVGDEERSVFSALCAFTARDIDEARAAQDFGAYESEEDDGDEGKPSETTTDKTVEASQVARDEERDAIADWIDLGATNLGSDHMSESQTAFYAGMMEQLAENIRAGLYRSRTERAS